MVVLKNRPCIIEGIRTPFVKAGRELSNIFAHDLGRLAVTELLYKADCDAAIIDKIIFGVVAQPAEVSNIARVIGLFSGLSPEIPAYTVQLNCASGLRAIASAADQIILKNSTAVICGGVESISNIPLKTNPLMSEFYAQVSSKLSLIEKAKVMQQFRPDFFRPVVALAEYLKDGYSGMAMGQTAELIAKKWGISREAQDLWALRSHERAREAHNNLLHRDEIFPIFIRPDYEKVIERDLSVRYQQSRQALTKLRPFFDRVAGTVTRGNMAPLVDGSAALLVMNSERAVEIGFKPEVRILAYADSAVTPEDMGLAPLVAIAKVLQKAKLKLDQIQLIEVNDTFAAHILALFKACKTSHSNLASTYNCIPSAEINPDIVNVNGGTLAIGHSLAASSARIVIHLMKELQRRDFSLGLAVSAANGGQALAMILERT
ncbi:thiolase family protein [candidate division CSSED10-310 bacterium]|uniref:Thiolase family protein n=1 Tax=candidate division CSSED10-310 bacterium TaxID=2855610 RepID=A0ABV6YYJ8_UNCC1